MNNLLAPTIKCIHSRLSAMIVMLALLLASVFLPHSSTLNVSAQDARPAGELSELAIEDGTGFLCVVGQVESQKGRPGFGWVNKLTPASYPATLRSITIGFNRSGPIGREVKPDALYRIVVFFDPEMDGPSNGQQPDATFMGRVRGMEQFQTFNFVTPLTITSGSFVVGAIDEFGIADLPALYREPGRSNPPGTESFITLDSGALWRTMRDAFPPEPQCPAGSLLIRATVESPPVETPTVIRIKDLQAVEPWGVTESGGAAAFVSNFVFVTNYVSDNLTIINKTDSSFQNVPVGDGPGGTPDGPFGAAYVGPANKVFVTLFGSNTIPSKEFPVDYSTVGPGRVAILSRQTNGEFAQVATINVGKGPRFPALVPIDGGKIYVPCGGANRVDVLSGVTNLKIAEIPVGNDPSSCAVSLTNAKVYVTNFGDGTISVIDPRTDQVTGIIQAPEIEFPMSIGPTPPVLPNPATAQNPWTAAVSQTNGNLYVTYWSTSIGGPIDVTPNGAIVEFDTCTDEFLRAIIDDTSFGTPAGSAGANGIPSPTAPLTRDGATGMTTEAGGGGGGPFGIASCVTLFPPGQIPAPQLSVNPNIIFTNDARGIVAALDTRIDQVVTAPPIALASCPKPRAVVCVQVGTGNQRRHIAYVACGQPDSSVLIISLPTLTRDDLPGLPAIESVSVGGKLRIRSPNAFGPATRVEVIDPATGACLAFEREPKFKKSGTLLQQKGRLTDDRKPNDIFSAIVRLIAPDGTVRLIFPPFP